MGKTETTNKKGGGIVGGLLLLLVGIGLLWYNEGRTVANQSTINEARKNYKDVASDKIDEKNEGKLISTKGKIDLSESSTPTDSIFGINAKAAKLIRTVEVYEWKEECTTDDNDKETCTYEKVWEDRLIDSSSFKESGHTNPTSIPYESETFLASNVRVGAFFLPEELINRLSTNKKKSNMHLKDEYTKPVEGITISGDYLTNVKENNPEIGNIRISFSYLDEETVSIMAVQVGNSFEAFTSKKGKDVYKILKGNYTGAQILEKMTKTNNTWKWILRILGTLLVIGAFNSMFSFITNLTDRIPILGRIVSGTTGLISAVLCFAISLIVIAIAWFRFRPILSIILLLIVVALVVFLKMYNQKKEK